MILKFRTWDNDYGFWSFNKTTIDSSHINDGKRFDVMQFTGAKDIHGADIYEGDIIRKEECSPDDPAFGHYGAIGVVKYNVDTMGFIIDSEDAGFYDNMGMNFSFDEIEVVGNVYENPDMVE